MTAAGHPVPLARGGAVERLRRAGAPVDEQPVVVLAAQAEPADVEPVAVVEVQPAEAQVPFRRVEFRGTVRVLPGERLALGPPLVVLRGRAEPHRGEPLPGGGPQRVEPLVQQRQVGLFRRQSSAALFDANSRTVVFFNWDKSGLFFPAWTENPHSSKSPAIPAVPGH